MTTLTLGRVLRKARKEPGQEIGISCVNFDNRGFTEVAPDLQSLTNLTHLSLFDNDFVEIPDLTWKKLIKIRLENNNIQRLDHHDLQGCTAVEELYLDRNSVEAIGNIGHLLCLRVLSISYQRIPQDLVFSAEFKSLIAPQLEYFDISGNLIADREILHLLTSIETLNVRDCGLADQEAFLTMVSNATSMRELDFRDNPIAKNRKLKYICVALRPSMQKINGEELSENDRIQANGMRTVLSRRRQVTRPVRHGGVQPLTVQSSTPPYTIERRGRILH
ncbi:hypothetical protein PCE1_002324 [Barthelona sp. PCE]